MSKRSISAKALVEDISNGLSDAELMGRHELSYGQLQKIFAQLVKAGYVAQEVLDGRRKEETETSSVGSRGTNVPAMRTESPSSPPEGRPWAVSSSRPQSWRTSALFSVPPALTGRGVPRPPQRADPYYCFLRALDDRGHTVCARGARGSRFVSPRGIHCRPLSSLRDRRASDGYPGMFVAREGVGAPSGLGHRGSVILRQSGRDRGAV